MSDTSAAETGCLQLGLSQGPACRTKQLMLKHTCHMISSRMSLTTAWSPN